MRVQLSGKAEQLLIELMAAYGTSSPTHMLNIALGLTPKQPAPKKSYSPINKIEDEKDANLSRTTSTSKL
ncbi:MAG: hypothetical protein ACOH2I_11520 [Pseudomonas sp.]